MKIETSVPDDVFWQAEILAERMGVSKGELFRLALLAYIESESVSEILHPDIVREKLDEVYSQESSEVDEVLLKMQWASLPKEDW